jgi:hypothetical protein
MTDIPYLVRLREDLVTGIARRQRRAAVRRRRAALVLTPAALAGAVLAISLPGSPSPALAIEPQGDWIEVRIADISASEAKMGSELRAAGIDADIRLVPTTADHVGQWTCTFAAMRPFVDPSAVHDGPPSAPDTDHVIRFTPEALYVRRGSAEQLRLDRIVIVAGRAAEPGEQPSARPELCGDVRRVAGR